MKKIFLMIKNHFPTVKIIETTLAKILDKLAKFSKLNFLAIGCSSKILCGVETLPF